MSKVTKEEALRYLDVIANFEPNDEWNAKMLDEYHELKKYINQQHNTNITVSDKELEEALKYYKEDIEMCKIDISVESKDEYFKLYKKNEIDENEKIVLEIIKEREIHLNNITQYIMQLKNEVKEFYKRILFYENLVGDKTILESDEE